MKNLMLILALAVVLTSAFVFAEEEAATATSVKDVTVSECFLDEDSDGVCDTCGKTAEECAADLEAGACETCTKCGDSDKVEEDNKDK